MQSSRSTAAELLDDHGYRDLDELRDNLCDMARYDRWLGVFDELTRLAGLDDARTPYFSDCSRRVARPAAFRWVWRPSRSNDQTTETALDVGVGSGAFIAHAQRCAPRVRWVALDLSHDVLSIAREHTAAPQVQARAQQLPFANASFDVVTCANTLHHLDERGATALLCECARVARERIVIIDLARGPLTHIGAILLTHLTSRNRLTRADGVQSAKRAYTAAEALALVQAAGLASAIVRQRSPFRFAITGES